MVTVFVYGTLRDRATAAAVVPSFTYRDCAVLDGLHRVDGDYPTLAPGGRTEGRLLETDAVDALDRYEGVDRGLYVRVSVPLAHGTTAETYVGDPAKLGVTVDWPGDGEFGERVRAYVDSASVAVVREA
jgi:gamma-glutamylcyclotransferase (GGCT)/AIG2-like uncharacterized protein YtfP